MTVNESVEPLNERKCVAAVIEERCGATDGLSTDHSLTKADRSTGFLISVATQDVGVP